MGNNEYHVPVLLEESIEALNIVPDGVYVDATFGGGGHSQRILQDLNSKGSLYAFDQDEDAFRNIKDDDRFTFIHSNFRYLKNFMEYYQVRQLDGVLMDLGVSSYQFDSDSRGFAFRFDQDLDMRMSIGMEDTAKTIIQKYSENDLVRIFSEYGEIRNSKTLARVIVAERSKGQKIETTEALNLVLDKCRMGSPVKYYAQVYQALRIEVNEEMLALKEFLTDVIPLLKHEARLVVISYHSLEDKLVKNFMKTGTSTKDFQKDDFGKIYRPLKMLSKKPIEAQGVEVKQNSRARSAKMRIAQKIEND